MNVDSSSSAEPASWLGVLYAIILSQTKIRNIPEVREEGMQIHTSIPSPSQPPLSESQVVLMRSRRASWEAVTRGAANGESVEVVVA